MFNPYTYISRNLDGEFMKHDGMIKKRTIWLIGLISLYFFVLIIRLLYLQVINPSQYVTHAESLWTRNMPIEGQRGIILDRNNEIIVNNVVAPSLIIIPRQVTDANKIAELLSDVLDSSFERMYEHATKDVNVHRVQPEGRKLDHDQMLAIKEAQLDGVYLVNDVMRYYPHGNLLAQVLGFTGIDNQGLAGIEKLYNDYLMGASGKWQYFSDAKGRSLEKFSDIYSPSARGMDMMLTIDLTIQEIMEREADNAMARYRADAFMAIAMDVNTGEILGMVSRPTFDPANYQEFNSEIYDRNLPIWMGFEPGSTWKPMTFAAALEEGKMTIETPFSCYGYSIIEGTRIRDWRTGGHGSQTMLEVIMNSCNPGFMTMGVELLGKDLLFQYIEAFGIKEKTGIDLLGEGKGIVFNPDVIGQVETATASFGQGNSMTPIQLVTALASVVNGGNLMTPFAVSQIRHPYTGEILFQRVPNVRRQVISQETSDTMRYVLENVGARGSGRGSFIDGFRIGGKTGTAQKPSPTGGYIPNEYILSFAGIAPMDDPQIILYVAVDNARDTIQYGGVVAAPIARNMFKEILPHLGIERRTEQIEKSYIWGDVIYVEVPDYIGKKRSEINMYTTYRLEFLGEGSRVTRQQPVAGAKIAEDGVIRLFMGD